MLKKTKSCLSEEMEVDIDDEVNEAQKKVSYSDKNLFKNVILNEKKNKE